jgi:hypothetical protein
MKPTRGGRNARKVGNVMNRELGGWLEAVLDGAQDARWCTRPSCTMCAAMDFRRAYWAAAARQAGITGRFESARLPGEIFTGISDVERQVLVRTLVAGLRELSPTLTDSEAFRTIVVDLDPPLIRHGVPIGLDTALSGTPAGEALGRMRAHARAQDEVRERRLAYESPQAVEERRRAKREERAAAHAQRLSKKRLTDSVRVQLLETLARLSPGERLSRFATDAALNLDSMPVELIPAQEMDLTDLERTQAIALLTRIGRRRGPWSRLRLLLEKSLR